MAVRSQAATNAALLNAADVPRVPLRPDAPHLGGEGGGKEAEHHCLGEGPTQPYNAVGAADPATFYPENTFCTLQKMAEINCAGGWGELRPSTDPSPKIPL